ncbi:uncharacterized protein MICPUCDRAFT_17539, partial [Micromonas pusilla CCMP1545]
MVLYTLTDYNGEGGGRVRIGGNRLAGTGSGPRRTVDVAAGVKHSVVVTEQNEVAAFGTDESGSTGQGDGGEGKMHRVPRWMYWISNETTRILSCAAGEAHTVLLSAGGTALTVGRGDVGQLGQGATRKCLTPRRIEALSGMKIVTEVCGGRSHTVILTAAGKVYTCGRSNRGQTGQGDDQTRLIVTAIPSMINLSCVQIAAGDEHTVMLTTLGHVYVCGKNDTGQLGDGTLDDSFIPKTLQPI